MRVIRVVGADAFIPLTQGKIGVIDAEYIGLVKHWNWCALKAESGLWYAARNLNPGTLRLHSVILPAVEGLTIDHRDGDGLNNRRVNLRHVTPLQQAQNRRLRADSITGRRGVSKRGSRFRARIVIDGERIILGTFDTAEEASAAFEARSQETRGEYHRPT